MRIRGSDRDLVAEYVTAVQAGGVRSNTAIAAELGVPRTSLDAALRKARAEADPRLAQVRIPTRRRCFEDLDVEQYAMPNGLSDQDVRAVTRLVAEHARDSADKDLLLDALFGLGGDAA